MIKRSRSKVHVGVDVALCAHPRPLRQRVEVAGVFLAVVVLAGCGTVDSTQLASDSTSAATALSSELPEGEGLASSVSSGADIDAADVTAAPAPGGEDINDVVAVEEQRVLAPADLTEKVALNGLYKIEVVDLTSTKVAAKSPGEVGGSAVRVDLVLRNESDVPLDLGGVTVTGSDKSSTPLSALEVDPAIPFEGDLPPGEKVEGSYLFTFPKGSEPPVTITVSPAPEMPVAVFVGKL